MYNSYRYRARSSQDGREAQNNAVVHGLATDSYDFRFWRIDNDGISGEVLELFSNPFIAESPFVGDHQPYFCLGRYRVATENLFVDKDYRSSGCPLEPDDIAGEGWRKQSYVPSSIPIIIRFRSRSAIRGHIFLRG